MTATSKLTQLDWRIRRFVYTFWIEHERPPFVKETAVQFALGKDAARASYRRLETAHHWLLDQDVNQIRMAFPLSAVPTSYQVHVQGQSLWANCAWDSLGIPAMLDADAQIEARDPLTQEVVRYEVRTGILRAPQRVVHFVLPVRQWYDDLIHT
ncbi:MAG: hypothetical protein GWP61_17740 [Chloroflexi bacterium]|jgi:hypothetical protein|nr:hypothetical protein [Chloroflexota bacterium]